MTTKCLIVIAVVAALGLIGWLLALQAKETVEELEVKLKEEEEKRTMLAKKLGETDKALCRVVDERDALKASLTEERRQTGIWKGATSAVTRMALKEITADKTARPTPAERRPAAAPALDPGRVVIIRGAVPVKERR
jgi:hypothetical protein